MNRRMLFLPLLMLMIASAAFGGAGFGPQAGYYKADGADEGEFLFGGALRLKPAPFFGIEGSINYRQESYNNDAVKVKSWPVMATALFYPIPVVYGLAGAGWYNTTFEYSGMDKEETTSEFGYHFGGGVELPLGDAVTIAGDIRYVFLDYEFEEFPGSEDTDSNFYAIMVSLLLGRL